MCAGLGSSSAMLCGSPAINKLACVFLGFYYIIIRLICEVGGTFIDIGSISACLSENYVAPGFGDIFEGFMNGFVDGAEIAADACAGIFTNWNAFFDETCPGFFDPLNGVLDILF